MKTRKSIQDQFRQLAEYGRKVDSDQESWTKLLTGYALAFAAICAPQTLMSKVTGCPLLFLKASVCTCILAVICGLIRIGRRERRDLIVFRARLSPPLPSRRRTLFESFCGKCCAWLLVASLLFLLAAVIAK